MQLMSVVGYKSWVDGLLSSFLREVMAKARLLLVGNRVFLSRLSSLRRAFN